jgi:mono/diheme cytochrome c family protein
LEWDSLPWGEGGKTFKSTCKSCHTKNHASAPFLWSESKTQKAWDRVFETRYPKCAQDGSWDNIGDDQLSKVHDYLWRWASDNIEHFFRGG